MVAKVLAVLFAVLTIPSVIGWWYQRDVLDPDGYLAIVAPLATEPRVRSELSEELSQEIIARLDVPSKVEQAALELPPGAASVLSSLAVPLESGVELYVEHAAAEVMDSEGFARRWLEANQDGHEQATNGETVYVDLGPLSEQVKARLVVEGFGLAATVPEVDKHYALITSPALRWAHRWYPLMKALPLVALVFLAAALLLARSRLQILFIASMGTAIAMLVLTGATYLAGPMVESSVSGAVYDAFAESLRSDIRWLTAISALVALGTWVLRRRLSPG